MKKLLITILLILTGLIAYFILGFSKDRTIGGEGQLYFSSIASSQVWVTSGHSRTILSAQTGRQYVKCTNMSTDQVYVAFNAIASRNWGFLLESSKSFEITPDVLYVGPISGRTNTASVSISCLELK